MEYPFDRVGLSDMVERAGGFLGLRPFGGEEKPGYSAWRRGWRFILRNGMGNRRWQARLKRARVHWVLDEIRRTLNASTKPVLVYLAPYGIHNMQSGGSKRVLGIGKVLSSRFSVFILTLCPQETPCSVVPVADDCYLIGIPMDAEFDQAIHAPTMAVGEGFFSLDDFFDLLPVFQRVLSLLGEKARAWGFASPVAGPVVWRYRGNGPVFYDAHDDYGHYLQSSFGCTEERLIRRIIGMEGEVLGQVDAAIFCTQRDRDEVAKRFPAHRGKTFVVPNGVDTVGCRDVPPIRAGWFRSQVGLTKRMAVFVGAHRRPNLEAAVYIASDLAPAFPSVVFVIAGIHYSAYRAGGGVEPGENVVFTGPVSEDAKEVIYALADMALAPMKSGTGSSLKIPEYIAHGKVVVGTPIGCRGYEDLLGYVSVVAEEDMRGTLGLVIEKLDKDPDSFTESCREARHWVETHLDWSVAARPLLDCLSG